ncbi:MAG TPA: peptidoglycan DD-metalloendopeptidase family protein [Alphaproteobacteria bacterium]|nr:peptidoglycan DD-metalloendopeptidase family protein [Alphaproteobacteria bacterium]
MLAFFTPLLAQAATSEDLARLQDRISDKQAEAQSLQQKANKTEGELKTLREKLVQAANEEKKSQERLQGLEEKLDALQKQEEEQRRALGQQQAKLSGVLAAMLRLSRMPPEVLMLRPEAPVDNLRSAILLREALPFYATKAQDLSTDIEKLHKTRDAILDKRVEMMEAQQNFGARQAELNSLLSERQAWLKATESQRADITRQIDALSTEAKNVQELMTRVTAPSVLKLGGKKPAKNGPLAFATPIKGRLIYGFGVADDVGSETRGITFSARAGDMIVAPADGQVVFAGPFKGYGNILILRHNDDYHSFLAGFGRVDAAVGQVVNAGEPLGKAPLDKGGSAQVYFELRYRGTPVDPMRRISATAVAANRSASP